MRAESDLRPALARKAEDLLRRREPAEREALLIKCWMSHDARWFMAVAREFGLEAANRVNQAAAHELGKVEAQRIARALGLRVASLDDYLVAQEVFIRLLGPDLLDYGVRRLGDGAYEVAVRRCFAHDNAAQAGIVDQYDCGIFARVTGWLAGLGLPCQLHPPLGKCLKAQGKDCVYTIDVAGRPD